jgi:predicted amidohydrolase YtcJ
VPEEKITVEEALRAYTMGDAYGVFAEDRRGKLAPGYLADLVLLDRDITLIPAEEIEQVAVKATVVGGRMVYSAR